MGILSKEIAVFKCQLCFHPSISTYRDYVDHMIDKHLRVQLLKGLDMTKKQPTCPFPSCHGMAWPIVDSLLFHYASHHNVLEKVVMYESEVAAEDLREVIKGKEKTIEDLVKEIGDIKNVESGTREDSKEDKAGGCIQGNKELRGVMEQMKEELNMLKLKIGSKNSAIKSLRDELTDARRSFKSCEERYEDVVKYNMSIQNELKSLKSGVKSDTEDVINDVPESLTSVSDLESKNEQPDTESDGKVSEENVSSTGESGINVKPTQLLDNGINQEEVLDDLKRKVERLSDQNEAWQKQNDSLQLEIGNMHMQNENLKNIIEIGKSTVETAKKNKSGFGGKKKKKKKKKKKRGSERRKTWSKSKGGK